MSQECKIQPRTVVFYEQDIGEAAIARAKEYVSRYKLTHDDVKIVREPSEIEGQPGDILVVTKREITLKAPV